MVKKFWFHCDCYSPCLLLLMGIESRIVELYVIVGLPKALRLPFLRGERSALCVFKSGFSAIGGIPAVPIRGRVL